MKKPTKKLLGLITLMPYTLLGLLFIDFLIYPQELLAGKWLTHVQVGSLLWIVGLLAFYFHHLYRVKQVDVEKRILWAVVLLIGNVFTMPIYWYKYIWHQKQSTKVFLNEDGSQIIGF